MTVYTNEFLRCLWAIFEKEFGKCAWYFSPYRIGEEQKVCFGFMDIGVASVFEVSIIYHQRGCIEELILKPRNSLSLEEEIIKKIMKCVHQARNYRDIGKTSYKVKATIKSYNRLLPYEGKNFIICPTVDEGCSSIEFTISAFNESQALEILQQKLQIIIDLLSVETNSIYTYSLNEKHRPLNLGISEEIYSKSPADLKNEENSKHIIGEITFNKMSKEFKEYLDVILEPSFKITKDYELYFRSCTHYHTAKKLYENSIFKIPTVASLSGENFEDMALTFYMSALEVITLKDYQEKQCSECNRPIFSIRQRVKSIVFENYGEGLAKVFGDYYDNRSKYLHSGISYVGSPRSTVSIPTLSLEHSSGCNVNFFMELHFIDDVVRDILRKNI